MEKTTVNSYSYVESPFTIRPGTLCKVSLFYKNNITVGWNSSIAFSYAIEGYVAPSSVSADQYIVPEISYVDGISTISIPAINAGTINIIINLIQKNIQYVTSFSSIGIDNNYCNYYIQKEGYIIPMTIIEYTPIVGVTTYQKIIVEPVVTNNGIEYIDDLKLEMNNIGLLKCDDFTINILRKGKIYTSIPLSFNGEYVQKRSTDFLVLVDFQDLKEGYSSFHDIKLYENNFIISTNKSLCVFNMYNDFQSPDFEDINIQNGKGLCINDDDHLLIGVDNSIYKFKIRHDISMLDKTNKCIYSRESDPRITINKL